MFGKKDEEILSSSSSNSTSNGGGDSIKEAQSNTKTNQLISFFNQSSKNNTFESEQEKRESKVTNSTEANAERKNINNSLLLKIEENLNTQLLQSGKTGNQNVKKIEPIVNLSELTNSLSLSRKSDPAITTSEGTNLSSSDWTLPSDTRRAKIRDESIRIGTKQAPPPIPSALFTGGEVLKNVPPGQLIFELDADFWVIDVVESKVVNEERVHLEAFSDGLKIQMKNEIVTLTTVLARSLPSLVSTEEYLQIMSKDFRTINLHFDSPEDKRKVVEFLNYFRSDSVKVSSPTVPALDPSLSEYLYDPTEEIKRQGYDSKLNLWRVAGSQDKRIVPFDVTDEILEGSKTFRHRGQIPCYCWFNASNCSHRS